MPLTAAEIIEHPAFKSVIWPLAPTKKGKCAVAHGRGGPFDIAYEIHGTGPTHLVVGGSQESYNVLRGREIAAQILKRAKG